mmetsp:Transcript_110457/g.330418  ORF Transcript_110457/g.330418 Transcript_110457/m.330418 type:complete len:154 (+) Transcript_110457:65-526(+)
MRSQRGGAAQSSGQASSSCGAMPAPRAQLAQAKASSQAVLAEAKANPAVPRGSVRSHPQPLEWVASLPPGLLERLLQGVEDGVRVVPTVGSLGHPWKCKSACRHHNYRSGCRNGPHCKHCHLCSWWEEPGSTNREESNTGPREDVIEVVHFSF